MSSAPAPLDDWSDPWSYAAYKRRVDAHRAYLETIRDKHSGAAMLLGNGPSLTGLSTRINEFTAYALRKCGKYALPTIGTNKSHGLVWPETYHVLGHLEHLDAAVPNYLDEHESRVRFFCLENANGLFIHGTSSDRGHAIPISHHSLFSTNLPAGACEGAPETQGSVILVAMQLAYWLGFRTFLLAGCELRGPKFYPGGPENPDLQAKMLQLWYLVRPHLDALSVQVYLVEPGEGARNGAWPAVSWERALEIAEAAMRR